MAEDAARELPNLRLEDALQLVKLHAERESPKYEKSARRRLERYSTYSGGMRRRHDLAVTTGRLAAPMRQLGPAY